MALIKCSECANEISDQASACPKCGAPSSGRTATTAPPPRPKRRTTPIAWIVLTLIVIGAGYFFFLSSQAQDAGKPQLPVEVKYRPALLGPGLVLAVTNKSERSLALMATFKNPTTHQEKSFRIDVAPKGTSEVGHLEGWTFASGDTITVAHNDYRLWNGNIP